MIRFISGTLLIIGVALLAIVAASMGIKFSPWFVLLPCIASLGFLLQISAILDEQGKTDKLHAEYLLESLLLMANAQLDLVDKKR